MSEEQELMDEDNDNYTERAVRADMLVVYYLVSISYTHTGWGILRSDVGMMLMKMTKKEAIEINMILVTVGFCYSSRHHSRTTRWFICNIPQVYIVSS